MNQMAKEYNKQTLYVFI